MAKHRQQSAGGDDGSCPKIEPEPPLSDHGDESRGTSSVLSSHQTRPLFGSLEEAHTRITRPQTGGVSRSVADETASSGSGDDTILKDMHRLSPADARAIYTNIGYPVTRAFGHSVTEAVDCSVDQSALVPSPLLVQKQANPDSQNNVLATLPRSRTAPISWQSPAEPWQSPPRRFPQAQAFAEANTSNQPPPYSPKNKLDRTLGHRHPAAQDSFSVEAKFCPHSPSVYGDHLAQENEKNTVLGCVAEKGIGSPPQVALPEDPPFHHTNPFAASAGFKASETFLRVVNASPAPESSSSKRLPYGSDSEDDRARIGSDLGAGSGIGFDSELGAGSDENKVPKLLPPPARMHSARRKEGARQSLVSSGRSSVVGGVMTEGSEEDPFHYDSVFLRPSREREVSSYLHQVSGVERGSTAIICSPDDSPLRTSRQFVGRGPTSPEVQPTMPDNQVSPLRLPQQRAAVGSDARYQQGQHFFEPSAINPEWTVGSPDVVRVPVRERARSCQRRNARERRADAEGGLSKLVLEGLRGCEGQNRLPTGNTEG